VRDTVERNIVDPTPDDILAVRREAAEAVIKIGAVPETVEVQVEVDTRRNLVRAIAFGTTELKHDNDPSVIASFEDCKTSAARSLQADISKVKLVGETTTLYVFSTETEISSFFGLFKTQQTAVRVTDKTGVVRLQRSNAEVQATTISNVLPELETVILNLTDFGDAGRSLPDIHLLVGTRIINLSGLADLEQALALAKTELENMPSDEKVVIVASKK
jgi:N-methylhydantoinase A